MSEPTWIDKVDRFVSLDLETFLIEAGLLAPRIVCGSTAEIKDGDIVGNLLGRDVAVEHARTLLNSVAVIVGANIAYDFGCLSVHDRALLAVIFRAYDEGRVYDIQIAQALDAIAYGLLYLEPDTRAQMRGRYSLATCTRLMLGRDDAKKNDYWRLRYALLQDIPLADWPEEARQYPIDDAVNTLEGALTQVVGGGAGVVSGPLRNLGDLSAQCDTAFCMHLSAMWGLRTDPERVARLRAKAEAGHKVFMERFAPLGFFKPDGKENTKVIKTAVIKAYGGGEKTCPSFCAGGKTLSPKTGNPVNCKACDGTGLDLTGVMRAPGGGVKTDRDTLVESGDDDLMAFGENENEKILTTYVPFLEQGVDRPITLRPNVLVASGRASYDGVIQQMPREGGARECVKFRRGYVGCSVDYAALELCTLAQVCLWLFGRSQMAETINATGDPGFLHTAFAAQLAGRTPEEMAVLIKAKDENAKKYRQAAKAGNFGFPGGMGAAKFVLSKRKKSEGTTMAPDGTVYPGIRFCLLLSGTDRCGTEKITSWRDKPTPPLCAACVRVVDEVLRPAWFKQWPEIKPYFDWVKGRVGDDRAGELPCFGTYRVRGGLGFTDGANNCVDFETEALTRRGWVGGNDLTLDDEILTKNADTGALEWQHPTAVNRFPDYEGPLVEFDSMPLSAVTTPSHRWLVHESKTGTDKCVTSETLSRHGHHAIHRTGKYVGADSTACSDDFLELVGWFLTDGSIDKTPGSTRIRLHQTKKPTVLQIDKLFARLDIGVRRQVRDAGAVVWSFTNNPQKADGKGIALRLRQMFPDRVLTNEFIAGLSRRQAALVASTMMLGDGTRRKRGGKDCCLYTKTERAADAFQFLLVMAGRASRSVWRDRSKYRPTSPKMNNIPVCKGIWTVAVFDRNRSQVVGSQVKEFVEKRGVWCPSVPNSYFVARRNKKVYITGNSFQALAADGAKHALRKLTRECYLDEGSVLYGTRPVFFVHDEIVAEMPEDTAHLAGPRMAEVMVAAMRDYVPDVTVAAAPALQRYWIKAAEPHYVDGRLVPWDDHHSYEF